MSTRNARLAAIRSFFHYVSYLDPTSMGIAQRVLSIPKKRTDRPVLDYLRSAELDAILAAPDRSTALGRRDHALLLFLGQTGARVSEAVAVNAVDVQLKRPGHVRLLGKGRKERVLPIDHALSEVLRALRDERGLGPHDEQPFFVSRRTQRLTRFGVTHILRRAVQTASDTQPKLATRRTSPHLFRHTAAMRLLQSGVDLTTIRSWLGHAHVDTTHRYLDADLEMKQRALAACEPTSSDAVSGRYEPPDEVLALLDRL